MQFTILLLTPENSMHTIK